MDQSRLEHRTIKIKQLVEDYRAGRIVIPEFQREYVWQKSKAPLLLDSLYRGYPVSSLLLWQSVEPTRALRAEPRPARSGPTDWLIDGQQRVITLSRVMDGHEGIHVVFHPDHDDAFKLENAATKTEPGWISVSDIWDDDRYRRLIKQLDETPSAKKREEKYERVRRILDYEIPLVRMLDHPFDQAVGAFKRINTLGVKLKKQDIESAEIASKHSGLIADNIAPYLKKIRDQGFDRLNVMHLFRACAFIAKKDGRVRTPLHALDRREVETAWNNTEKATDQVLNLVRGDLGLMNMSILWSGALLVPAIAIYASLPPKERSAKEIVGWLVLASLLRRYSNSSETALDQDLKACRNDDPVGALLKNLRTLRESLAADPRDFAGSLNDRSGLFCLYLACKQKGCLDFFTGGKIILQPNVDRHHILPRAQFPANQRSKADNVANIAFIASDVNKSINVSGPEVYLKRIDAEILQSQCVPVDQTFWRIDEAESFWSARRVLLAGAFNDFVKSNLAARRL